ncbi:trafficking kinesin-binding protein 1-like isoform X1 [Centruroides vittatus]|uniref:trafficking kinesin-binding protein 1-like isoform X1 n=2 Tax=Centruroides vittatus TaxID=120091 RepID=UPI00351018E1
MHRGINDLFQLEELVSIRLSEQKKNEVLCSDRLSQMTKTYNDIDAVTRLLEEKERDLELAARIGQSLLEQNKDLRLRNEQLEQDLTIATETEEKLTREIISATEGVTQLKHELSLKNGLLQIYTQDLDTESDSGSPSDRSIAVNWEMLNKKIQNLQEENMQLRNEAVDRTIDIENEEKKEMQLINDCVRQLSDANIQITSLQEEVAKKTDDSIRQQEEITQLLSQVVDLQRRVRDLTAENEILQSKVQIAEECQQELSTELIDIKEKYGELMIALQELQEEAKKMRHNKMPKAAKWPYGVYTPYINPDSLASELESSLGLSSNGYSSDEKSSHSKRVFDTVKCANTYGNPRRRGSSQSLYTQSPSRSTLRSTYSSLSQISSASSCNESQASDSESAYAETDDDQYSSVSGQDRLGSILPHSNTIESTLRRFSSGIGTATDLSSDDGIIPARCWTPESNFSINSNRTGFSGRSGIRHYHMPEKLQIIKPLEGSQTLHQWQRLATPHLGGIFEAHPGVQIKGEVKLEDEEETYNLSDYEEDEEFCHPGKSFMNTSSIYTYTNSTILHPSDQTQVTPSYSSLQISSRTSSQPPSTLNSPQQRGRATSTFSTTLGLARLLNERGIHAIVPTAVMSNQKIDSTPPTPAPSPEGSPPLTPPPFSGIQVPDLINVGSLARGVHLLRRTRSKKSKPVTSKSNSHASSHKKESEPPKIGLLDKLSRIGLENIMSTTASEIPPSIAECKESRFPRITVKLKTFDESSPLTLTPKTDVGVKTRIDLSCFTQSSMSNKSTVGTSYSTVQSWSCVPSVKSTKANTFESSNLPKPAQLLNIQDKNSNIGTIGALRTLRKGGYI